MHKAICLIIIGLAITLDSFCQQRAGFVSGTVTNQAGQPVENLTVFIPSTSIGSTTNSKGEFTLDKLKSGLVELIFRHIAYLPESRNIEIIGGVNLKIDIVVKENTIEIDEVIKKADQTNWDFGYERFKEYVIGDPKGRFCKVLNPEDLYFYFDGEVLTGHAVNTLHVVNNYLGYEMMYFLDYFKFFTDTLNIDLSGRGGYYVFQGSSYYMEKASSNFLQRWRWKLVRREEFKGTLPHFLASLYHGMLAEYGYQVKEAWTSHKEYIDSEDISPAIARVRSVDMDSVYDWNAQANKSQYLHYFPYLNCNIESTLTSIDGVPPLKSLNPGDRLLIFHNRYNSYDPKDLAVTCFYIDTAPGHENEAKLIFDSGGHYELINGEIVWRHLDNMTSIIRALPADYYPVGR